MPWVRKDDQMPIHRKVAPLSDAAYRLLDEAICWSSRNRTDGRIGTGDLAEISKRGKLKYAAELVARDLWHDAGTDCSSEYCAPTTGRDGWVIHDYLEYNPSADQVSKERKAKTERQRRWRESRRGGRASTRGTVDGPVDASRNGAVDAHVDASVDAPVDAAPRAHVSRPVPPRPETGAGTGSPPATAARRAAAGAGGGDRGEDHSDTHAPSRLTGSPDYDAIQRAAAPPPADLLEAARQKLKAAAAARHARDAARADPLAELRALTPNLPTNQEPTHA